MDDGENRGGALFPSTAWSVIQQLQGRDDGVFAQSLERLVRLYWKPVYCLVRFAYAKNREDARDLTQDFFARVVLEDELVLRYDAEKGSFRAFLKGALARFVSKTARDAGRQKRGGDLKAVGLDEDLGAIEDAVSVAQGPEEAFDLAWRHLVLERAVGRLADQLAADGKHTSHEIFCRYDLAAEAPPSYAELGRELGLSPDQVKHHLAHARAALRAAVAEIVSEYVVGPESLQRELKDLLG